MKTPNMPRVLISIGIIVALAAALRAQARLEGALDEQFRLQEEVRNLATYKKALFSQLNELALDPPFLKGQIGAGPVAGEMVVQEPGNVVLYLISTDCPHSPINYGFLNELVDSGVPVVGLATDTILGALEHHQTDWELRFPVLFLPEGSAARLVPRYGTPTLVVVSDEEVALIEFGELGSEAQDLLKDLTKSWTRDRRALIELTTSTLR